MTETAAQYIAAERIEEKKFARCPNCNSVFGREIEDGKYLLIGMSAKYAGSEAFMTSGGLRVQKLMAVCTVRGCGEPIMWASSDRHLRRIIDKKKKRSHNRTTSV